MQDALDTMLANAKIAANEQAATIRFNREQLRPQDGVAGEDWISLFPDFTVVCAKPRDDFHNLVTARVAAHRQKLEQERDRIRQEEERKVREKVAAEQREQQEREAAAQRAQAVPASTPAAPIPPMAAIHAPASNTPLPQKVTPITRPQGKPSLRLGEINERLAPLSISEAGLAKLGFPAAGRDRSAVLFHEADFEAMCDSIVAHVRTAQQHQHEAEAA
jgi:hypothetical protein